MTDTLTPPTTTDTDAVDPTEAMVDRLFEALLGTTEVYAAFLGDRLGWYDALAESSRTAPELAEATGTDARYAREWLEHQTVAGYLTVVDPTAEADELRFEMPEAHRPVLADRDDLAHVLPLARFVGGLGLRLDDMVDAYRTGAGIGWHAHGAHGREGQAAANRPMFLNQLGPEYLAAIPEVDEALRGGGCVADVGCGFGWSAIGVALAYPDATVDGFDIDAPSVERARENAAAYGVADRVRFHVVDAGDDLAADHPGTFDVVLALECIHDLPQPVEVLSTMRRLTAPDGTTIVMDERVGERFTGEGDPIERIMYGFSLLCCLPDGRAHEHSVATGTVMRPATLEGYATDAGFGAIEILPLDNDFFRFYRLVPTSA